MGGFKEVFVFKISGVRGVIGSPFYPYLASSDSAKMGFKNRVIIGIGGNVGDTKMIFNRLFWRLKRDARFRVIQTSPIIKNAAFGYESADYLNAAVELSCDLSASEILKAMARIEWRFGRKRPFKNAPRTLDLDILYFSSKVLKTARLTVPHPGAGERVSVYLVLGMMKGSWWLRY